MTQIKGRLTKSKMIEWVNNEFKRFEIDYVVFEIVSTRFRGQDIEAGACRLLFRFKHKDHLSDNDYGVFLCFYTLKEYEEHLIDGYRMYLRFNGRNQTLSNLEIELKKQQ